MKFQPTVIALSIAAFFAQPAIGDVITYQNGQYNQLNAEQIASDSSHLEVMQVGDRQSASTSQQYANGSTLDLNQKGSGNSASITQSGESNTIDAEQIDSDNTGLNIFQGGTGNYAKMLSENSNGTMSENGASYSYHSQNTISQSGYYGYATIDQKYAYATSAGIYQDGNFNRAQVNQDSTSWSQANINQYGGGSNLAQIDQFGGAWSSANITQSWSFQNIANIWQQGNYWDANISANISQSGYMLNASISENFNSSTAAYANQSGDYQQAVINQEGNSGAYVISSDWWGSWQEFRYTQADISQSDWGNQARIDQYYNQGSAAQISQQGNNNVASIGQAGNVGGMIESHYCYDCQPYGVAISQIGDSNYAATYQYDTTAASASIQQGVSDWWWYNPGFENLALIQQYNGENMHAGIRQSGDYNFALISQTGNWNEATIAQEGYNNRADIWQNGNGWTSWERNYASITQAGSNFYASVTQNGAGNWVSITQR